RAMDMTSSGPICTSRFLNNVPRLPFSMNCMTSTTNTRQYRSHRSSLPMHRLGFFVHAPRNIMLLPMVSFMYATQGDGCLTSLGDGRPYCERKKKIIIIIIINGQRGGGRTSEFRSHYG